MHYVKRNIKMADTKTQLYILLIFGLQLNLTDKSTMLKIEYLFIGFEFSHRPLIHGLMKRKIILITVSTVFFTSQLFKRST